VYSSLSAISTLRGHFLLLQAQKKSRERFEPKDQLEIVRVLV
jgi:hypothetical protein